MINKRLIILIPCFHDGGVETWVKSIFKKNKNLNLILVIHGEITKDVSFAKEIYNPKTNLEILSLFKKLKLDKSDTVFSSLTPSNIRGLIFKSIFRYKHIVGVQVTLMRLEWESYFKYFMRKLIYKILFLFSDRIYVASSGLKDEITRRRNNKIKVFWNPIITKDFLREYKKPLNKRDNIILAVGRLELQKDFEHLIRSIWNLSLISELDFKLIIVGNGTLETNLKNLVKDLKINEKVEFLPFSEDIFDYYSKAKVFVLSSIYEGFGNVLAEALFSTCYCISYDINHGPRDILDDGKFGVLLKERNIKILSKEIKKGLLYEKPFYGSEKSLVQFGEEFTSEKYLEKLEKDINEMVTN